MSVIVWSLGAVVLVSAMSLLGIALLFFKEEKLNGALFFLVSISAGALFGDAFIHLIPEALSSGIGGAFTPYLILLGILIFFSLEKFLHWHHHHTDLHEDQEHHKKIHPVGPIVLFADVVHNMIDGVVIAASFLISIPVGIATTLAVMLHEIPHEVGNVALLIHAGFKKKKAILFNCYAALASVVGAVLVLFTSSSVSNLAHYLVPIAAGGFIYIAGSDLVPELHKDVGVKKSLLQTIGILIGIFFMTILLFLE